MLLHMRVYSINVVPFLTEIRDFCYKYELSQGG